MRLFDAFDFQAMVNPGAPFATDGGREMTYGEAGREARRIANALVDAGLEKGERIAFLSKNSLEHVLLYYGAAKAGVVPVPLNYRLAAPEWSYILNDAGAKLLVASSEYAEAIAPVRGQLGQLKRLVAIGGAKGWDDYRSWVDSASDAPVDRHVSESDDLYQMYTSGTTGRPKGAVLTHHAVTSNVIQFHLAYPGELSGRFLVVAPLYHAAAAICSFLTISAGGSLLILPDFNPVEVVDAMSEGGVTLALLVPAMIQACLVMVPDVAKRKYDRLERVLYGASPIAEETLRRAMEVFGCKFIQGYGMTETTAALTNLRPEDHERALREKPELLLSAGRALPGTDLKIVDDQDRPVPNGTIGEICGRGPQLMKGYWNLPDATASALVDGWMHTGDAGTMDDEGFVYIQDRVKDMIVSGGENVYPREVEEVLYKHPAVAEAAVIGVPDEKWGEAVKAIVVLKKDAKATSDDILGFCKDQLGGYKRPRSIEFIDTLPRNPSGKVLKKDLREPYWKGQKRRVS